MGRSNKTVRGGEIIYLLTRSIVDTILYVGNRPNCSLSDIKRKTKVVYPHINKIFKLLVVNEILEANKTGRKYQIRLTDKGKRIYSNLKLIKKEFNGFVVD